MSQTAEEIARDWDNAKKVGAPINNEIKRAYKGACSKPQNEGLKLLQLLKSAMRKPLQLRKTKELIATAKLNAQVAINERFQIAMEILPEILEDEDLADLKKLALQKITSNAKELFGSRHFQELPLEALREIFKEDLAATEEEILTATRNWAQFQIHHRIQGFPGGDENVKIPLEDVTKEICAAIKDIIPKKSLDEFITMLNNNQGSECEVIQEQDVDDSAEVVLKEEINIDDKNFLDFSAIDYNATNGNGGEEGGITENSAQDKSTEIENRDLSNLPSTSMKLVKSESAVDVLDKNGEGMKSPEVLDLDGQVGHIGVAVPVAVDARDSDNPGAGNEENAQNSGNEEGDLEQSRIVYEAKAGIDNPQMTSSDETPPQPLNPEAVSFMELEDRNEDSSTAAERSVDGGVDLGSKEVGTIPQPMKTEVDENFYIDIKEDHDSDSSEEDNNLSICDSSESAKIRKRSKVATPEIPILNAASRLAVQKWIINRTDKQRPPKTTDFKSSSFRLKSVFVSLKRLSAAQILSMKNKMGVKSKPGWECPHCPRIFGFKSDLDIHIRCHTGERPFRCPHCPKAFTRRGNLRCHIRKIHLKNIQNSISCRICTEKFASRWILSAHMKNHLKCYFCSRSVRRFTSMQSHLVTHTGEKPLSCPHCQYETAQAHQLKEHVRIKHSSSTKNEIPLKPGYLKCPHCTKILKRKSLARHIRIHTGELTFPCPHCPKIFTQRGNMRRHIQKIHPKETQNSNKCRICQSQLKSRKDLQAHMKNHLKCYFCSLICPDFGTMLRHLRTHTGEKPFSCPHCPHSTSLEHSLKKHIHRIHVKQPLIPSHNPKYNSWKHLRTYGQLHCYFCSHKTNDAGNLVSHVRTHTSEKPFRCPRCSYAAKHGGNLKCHLKNHCK